MKTSSESRRGCSPSSRPRSQARPGPSSKSSTVDKAIKKQTRTRIRTKSRTTMNENPPPDTINLDSSNEDGPPDPLSSPDLGSGSDVVDLTSVTSDPVAVVDLTNDTVLVVDEDETQSSDEVELTALAAQRRRNRSPGVHISCPLCMDSYSQIVDSGRLLVSTRCGHVFCSICLRDSLNHSRTCPICRKRLSKEHYHPLYM